MDDDDYSHPSRIENQLDLITSKPEYSIIGTSVNMYDNRGIWGKSINSGERSKKEIVLRKNFVHPTVLMNKEHLLRIGCYSTDTVVLRTEDYDLWCKFYYHGFKGYNMDLILLDYYEGRESFGKRKYRFRINEFKLRLFWSNKFKMSFWTRVVSLRPLIVGLVPTSMMRLLRKIRFKLKVKEIYE